MGYSLMDAYEPEAPEAVPQSPYQAPLSLAHAHDPEEDPKEEPFEEEELLAPVDSLPAGLYINLPSEIEEDELGSCTCTSITTTITTITFIISTTQDSITTTTTYPRYIILEADMPPQKRAGFASPSHRFEIGKSLAAAAARQPRSSLARGTEFGFMTALDEVNKRVTGLASHRHDSEEFHVCHQDAKDDRVVLRARVSSFKRQRRYHHTMAITAEQEATYAR
nr:hypothetical protein [Tanacetum cinerariifolium]